MEVHFYPGQDLLVIKQNGLKFAQFEAMGGPPQIGNDPNMA